MANKVEDWFLSYLCGKQRNVKFSCKLREIIEFYSKENFRKFYYKREIFKINFIECELLKNFV